MRKRPALERLVAITAGVEFLVAMQAQIDEVGRQVLEQRPAVGCVGDDERDTVATQQRDELRVGEASVVLRS